MKGDRMDLKTNRLFNGVSSDFIRRMEEIIEKEDHGKGEILFKTGDPAENFYILEEGRICICAEKEDHSVSFIHTPGAFFGWSSLLNRLSYSASAEATIPTRVLRINRAKLEELFKNDPENALVFFRNFTDVVGGRFIDGSTAKDWFPSVST